MSKQLKLAKFVADNNTAFLKEEIIKIVSDFLKTGKDLDSESAYGRIFDDGMFEPFFNAPAGGEEYMEYTEENGNEDDESLLISKVWIKVLTDAGVDDFLPVIAKFKDIEENGI